MSTGRAVEAQAALDHIGDAVRQGLDALALPTAHADGYDLRAGQEAWLARVSDGRVIVAADMIVRLVRADDEGHTRAFRTLVHEAIHARGTRSPLATVERAWRGYEEGLSEGLARIVVHEKAGIAPVPGSFAYHVAAYRTLAQALELEAEVVFRRLWRARPGAVRDEFVRQIVALYAEQAGRTMNQEARMRLAAVADTLFSTRRIGQQPNDAALRDTWMRCLDEPAAGR